MDLESVGDRQQVDTCQYAAQGGAGNGLRCVDAQLQAELADRVQQAAGICGLVLKLLYLVSNERRPQVEGHAAGLVERGVVRKLATDGIVVQQPQGFVLKLISLG